MSKTKYYAIRNGRESNLILTSWDAAEKLIKGFHNAEYKSFSNRIDAQKYLDEGVYNKAVGTTHERQKELQLGTIPDRVVKTVYCEANCEMKINGICTQNVIRINKDGQCENY